MLKLKLYHGRHTPDEEIDEKLNGGWGFDGPILEGITGMGWTYGVHLRVEFVDAAATEVARQLTGWEQWDTNVLCMIKCEDLIMTAVPKEEAPAECAYYGDFALYQSP
jgi:hypothetical protein